MNCRCGCAMRRTEKPTPSGQRRTVHLCEQCYRFEIELRSSTGLLVRWTQGIFQPNQPNIGGP